MKVRARQRKTSYKSLSLDSGATDVLNSRAQAIGTSTLPNGEALPKRTDGAPTLNMLKGFAGAATGACPKRLLDEAPLGVVGAAMWEQPKGDGGAEPPKIDLLEEAAPPRLK